jgi:NlpC/P60 family putative phage cell wall peptidase
MTGADVVNEARTWLGTRWQHQAMLKGIAVDCVGLIVGVGRELGLLADFDHHAPRYRGYGRQPKPEMMLAGCDEHFDRVAFEDLQLGDLILMRVEKDPQHFAIVTKLDPLYIIHSYTQTNAVTEHGIDEAWRSRFVRAYRFRGLE